MRWLILLAFLVAGPAAAQDGLPGAPAPWWHSEAAPAPVARPVIVKRPVVIVRRTIVVRPRVYRRAHRRRCVLLIFC